MATLQQRDGELAKGLALIFDMDGVIVDSNPLHREAWVAFNRSHGVETTEAMLDRMYGRRNDQIVRDYFGDALTSEEVVAYGAAKEVLYRDMVAPRLEEMLVPGLRAFLDLHKGAPMAVASNAEPENVNLVLDQSGLRPYFRIVVNGSQVSQPKPHPEMYLRASEILGIVPSNCIVLEDSHTGIAAARAAGMRVIGLRTTHVNLSSTDITVDNFLNGSLSSWLRAQEPAV